MIDRVHDLPIAKQAEALNISRGSVYYLPRPAPEADLAIMRRLVPRDNQGETAASIRMRMRRGWPDGARA